MAARFPRASLRITLAVTIAGGVVLGAAACTAFGTAPASPAGPSGTSAPAQTTASEAPSDSSTPSVTPTRSLTPTPTPTPVAIACAKIFTAQQVYDFNPNFAATPKYQPAAGSLESKVVAQAGVACSWQNESGAGTVQIGVARPAASELTLLSGQAAQKYSPVPTYGNAPAVTGYFSPTAHAAQVFTRGYWVTVDSPLFQEPGDAEPIVADVLKNLP